MRDSPWCDAIAFYELDILREGDAGPVQIHANNRARGGSFHQVGKPKRRAAKLAADLDDDFRLRFVNDFLDHPKIEHVLPGWYTAVVHLFRYKIPLIILDPFAQ